MINKLKVIYNLGKFNISLAISFTCMVGYFLHGGGFTNDILILSISLVFFTSGSLAINQIQERDNDKLMDRTKRRPIPSKKLSIVESYIWAIFFLISSSISILYISNIYCLTVAYIAIIIYNLVYTPLKKKTALAIIPGAFSGCLPPLIGWYATGDYTIDASIVCFSIFVFLGQIPHFILLLFKYSEEYHNAGFKTLSSVFSTIQLKRINTIWIISFVCTALMFPLFDILININLIAILLIISIALLVINYNNSYSKKHSLRFFIFFNVYFTLSNILIILEKL